MDQTADRRSAFSAAVERELQCGELVFPTSMQAALKIRRALEDENAGLSAVAHVVGLEPLLAVKLLRMANSAHFSPRQVPVSDVYRALLRVGVDNARLLAVTLIGEQLATAEDFAPVRALAQQLWDHSLDVASLCYAIAVQAEGEGIAPDTALLTGMVHSIGQFYLLARSREFPELLEEQSELADFILDWNHRIGQAVLVALGTPAGIVDAIDHCGKIPCSWPPTRLADILFLASTAASVPNPFSTVSLEALLERRRAAFSTVDPERLERVLDEARIRRAAALAMLAA
ncbi:MAG: HDOD domain-containing protein [Candidatus Dactylopiibacterium sp.]|nr:HDOD domain-containing protein [Candidatus Dactylopiibacterium sp.]